MASRIDVQPELGAKLAGRNSGLEVGVAVSAALELPGLSIGVDHARAGLLLAVDDQGRPRIPLALVPTFEAPRGMHAALDLPGATGGGYLEHVGSQWRGALQASLGPISVSGFGILDTEPFGLLVVLAAEFAVPIQLSFGFTLVGVGGILGINRRPDRDQISAAVSSGDLSKLLFPRDAAAEADRLLPVLDRCFEKRDGSFVVGPMLKMGWGTPTIIAATIGVLVSDDALTILGRIAISLPFEAFALVHLEAVVSGRVDADGLRIDASLANSHIVGVPVEGDIKLRLQPDRGFFAFSAGGFNPALPVPDGMGGMRRIGTHVSPGPLLDLRVEAYLAITTNSVQFGARVDITYGFGGFGIRGMAAFDALFVFDPSFRFETSLEASVSIVCADFEVGSIGLRGDFSGPAPWRIHGSASFKILFWRITVGIPEITFGDSANTALPAARDPVGVLAGELARPLGWSATSRDVPHLVHLRSGVAEEHGAVHPLAQLGFRQQAVPLGTELRRMDGVALGTPVTLTVNLKVGNDITTPVLSAMEAFVPRQFFDIDDNASRSSAGYEQRPGGFDLRSADTREGDPVIKNEKPELLVFERQRVLIALLVFIAQTPGVRHTVGHDRVAAEPPPAIVALRDPNESRITTRAALTDRTAAVQQTTPAMGGTVIGSSAAHVLAAQSRDADLQVVAAWELA